MIKNTTEILDKLVSFDTTSHLSNLDLIHWVADYLKKYGISSEILCNEEKTKANLFATIGDEQLIANKAGMILSGHTDVVPVTGQDWSTNPFELIEKQGKLFARGSSDMKGFIACVLAMVPSWAEQTNKSTLKFPLHLAFSYDEEIGCLGVRPMIEHIEQKPIKISGAIIGEPTLMKPVIAHKGIRVYKIHTKGRAVHSSLPHTGVNAIQISSQIINYIYEFAQKEAEQGFQEEGYDVPFSTINVGVIKGGEAMNMTAQDCELTLDHRFIAKSDPDDFYRDISVFCEDLERKMQAVAEESKISIQKMADTIGLSAEENQELASLVRALTTNDGDQAEKVAYSTEAGLFSEIKIPAIVCGPGSIDQAHKVDEYIQIDQLEKCLNFLQKLTS